MTPPQPPRATRSASPPRHGALATKPRKTTRPVSRFGRLLQQHRLAVGLSQKQLAQRTADLLDKRASATLARNSASISASTISSLERGLGHVPRELTVLMLTRALILDPVQRETFLAAAYQLRRAHLPVPGSRRDVVAGVAPFIGRTQELSALQDRLPTARLLTLTAPGGCGKTRLALELVAAHAGEVWFVDLGAVTDEEGIARAILNAAGLRPPEQGPAFAALLRWAAQGTALLVLDNCEHLHVACGELVGALLAATPLRVVATSQRALGAPGEVVWHVPALSVPHADTVEAVLASEAGRLLLDRAGPSFALTERNAPAVAGICRRLDGQPLALELAAPAPRCLRGAGAARSPQRTLHAPRHQCEQCPAPPTHLAGRLRLELRTAHPGRASPPAPLGDFPGGFTLDATEAICADAPLRTATTPAAAAGGFGPLQSADLALAFANLVEHSLVTVMETSDEGCCEGWRYRLLATVREYAHEHLVASGESDSLAERHCTWYCALTERVPFPLDGGEATERWLANLAPEESNLRAALGWAGRSNPEARLRLIGASWNYWFRRSSHLEARELLNAALAAASTTSPWRGRAHYGLGFLELFDNLRSAREHLMLALSLAEAEGNRALAIEIGWPLAFACLGGGAHDEAEAHLEAGWALLPADDAPGLCSPYAMMRGYLALVHGDMPAGRDWLQAAHVQAAMAGQSLYRCIILVRLGTVYLRGGDPDEAIALFEQALQLATTLESWFYRFVGHFRRGEAREWANRLEEAVADYSTALAIAEAAGSDRFERVGVLLARGRLAFYLDEPDLALTWLRQCEALLDHLGHHILRRDLAFWLGRALWRAGRMAEAIPQFDRALALHEPADPPSLALYLESLAGLALGEGAAALAAQWCETADTLRLRTATPRPQVEAAGFAAMREVLVASLGPDHPEYRGRALAPGDAIASARAWLRALES